MNGINPSDVETEIFHVNLVNTMATDALAACVIKSTAIINLTM